MNRRDIKYSTTPEELAKILNITIKALELCNESRNRLTPISSTPDFWLNEAQGEIGMCEKKKMIIQFKNSEYIAKEFSVCLEGGEFKASGTLCGHIDFVVPLRQCKSATFVLSPDEAKKIAEMLRNAASDVLLNSRPYDDPRLYEKEHHERG